MKKWMREVTGNIERPNYSPSTKHFGKALLLWQLQTPRMMTGDLPGGVRG